MMMKMIKMVHMVHNECSLTMIANSVIIAQFKCSLIIFQHLIDVCTETLAKNCSLQVLSEIRRDDLSFRNIFWQKMQQKTNE